MINQDDVASSVNLLNKLIEQESKSVPDQDVSRIFIGGFSQGAMVSLATLISWKGTKPLGGVVALSGFQVLDENPATINMDVLKNTPLFTYNGHDDQVLPFKNAETTFGYLKS